MADPGGLPGHLSWSRAHALGLVLQRLTQAVYPAFPSGPGASTVDYTLDAVGNRLDDGTASYSYDAADRHDTPGYSYDANGNLLSDGSTSYSYDAANRLIQTITNYLTPTSSLTTTYGYDGWGNLVRETVQSSAAITTTDFVLDEQGGLTRILGAVRSDDVEELYAYGPEGLAAQRTIVDDTPQDVVYPLLDGLGSVRHLTDDSGTLVLSQAYDAWGAVRQRSGAASTRLGFAGELMAPDGTIYLRARAYQPSLGRFLQRDSFPGIPSTPQSLHRYLYAHNNPANWTDPSGRCLGWIWGDPTCQITRESASRATVVIGATVATIGVCALTAGIGCIVVGAVAGGAQAYGLQVIGNAADGQGGLDYSKGGVFTDVNVREIAVATIAGGVFGAASKVAGNVAGFFCKVGPQCQMLLHTLEGAAGAGSAQITTNVLDGNPCTRWSDQVLEQTLTGGIIGLVVGRVLAGRSRGRGPEEPPAKGPGPEEPPTSRPPRLPCASSFSAETLVTTADGLRPISTIRVGDLVLAYDEATRTTGLFTVTAVLIQSDPAQVHLIIGGVPLETTPEHPFFTMERGWVAAGDLWRGAHVRRADGSYDSVWSVAVETEPQVMYNLTIAQAHTFFVGSGRWLVHNAPGKCFALVGDDADLAKAAKWLKPQTGETFVLVHGMPGSRAFAVLRDGQWVSVNQRSLATFLKKSGYTGGKIKLISCWSGACPTGIAQDLANKLGTTVEAPTSAAWVWPSGRITLGPTPTANTGKWVTFNPRGK